MTIINRQKYQPTKNIDDKISYIIERLNDNLICKLKKLIESNTSPIQIKKEGFCECYSCSLNHLNFSKALITLKKGNSINPKKYFFKYLNEVIQKENIEEYPFLNTTSPYTGLSSSLRKTLNQLVEVLIVLNDKSLLKDEFIKKIMEKYPYYNFIINLMNEPKNLNFKIDWILENDSNIVLTKLGKTNYIKDKLQEHLTNNFNKRLAQIYFIYFKE